MKKFVNVRLPVIIALALCAGIAVGLTMYFYNFHIAWIALSAPVAGLIIALWAILKSKLIKPIMFVLLPAVIFASGAIYSYFSLKSYDFSEMEPDVEYYVRGTVIEKGTTTNGEYIIIKNITLDGNRIKGNAYVYLSPTYGELCDVGYSVDFKSKLEKPESFEYGVLNSYAEDNIKYRCSVFAGLQSTYGYSFFGSIRTRIRNVLFDNLNSETAAVSFAMLTGNTQAIGNESLQSFRYGGVAHIFAVSGLHIGLIYGIIIFVLKKCKLKNIYISSVVALTAILFYTAVCGFALSALRALIMCFVSTAARLLLQKYDGLNSLAVAVIVILFISPLSLYSVGFQLSVCAVGGIYCLSKCIENLLKKIKLPKPIRSSLGVTVGAQLGTMPIMLSTFGYLSGAGILLGVIVLPVLSAIFSLIFVTTMLSAVIPAIAPFVIPYAALPLELIMSTFIGAGFENALITGFGTGLFIPLYFIGILSISDKINLKTVHRIIALGCAVTVLAIYVLVRYCYPFSGYRIIVSAYDRGGEVIIKSPQGTALIVTDNVNTSRLNNMLNRNYVNSVDALIILGDDSVSTYANLDIGCKIIYVCDRYPQIQPYGDLHLRYESNFTACGINFTFYDQSTLLADVGGVDLGICSSENTLLKHCDIYISDNENKSVDCGIEVYFNNRCGTLNVLDLGDIFFNIDGGKFRLKNTIPPRR